MWGRRGATVDLLVKVAKETFKNHLKMIKNNDLTLYNDQNHKHFPIVARDIHIVDIGEKVSLKTYFEMDLAHCGSWRINYSEDVGCHAPTI